MARKTLFIVFLLALLVGFFYYKPLFERKKPLPSLVDRMPDGAFIGKIKILDVARETSAMMFHNKVAFRDFVTPEFILAQGKGYGIDVQKPAYFFVNNKDEWGAIIELFDNSKVMNGINRLRKNVDLADSAISDQRIYIMKSERVYIAYDKKWLFIYKGNQFPKRLYHVKFAEKGEAKKSWKSFSKEKFFKQKNLSVYSNSKELKDMGLKTALFSYDNDSSFVNLKLYVRNDKPLGIMKKTGGISFKNTEKNTDKLINVHLDISDFKEDKQSPIYKVLAKYSKKISFPLDAFLKAWEGDISFYQGGILKVKESFIETVMDENFNITEVKSYQEKEVPGFAFMMSCNGHHKHFLNQLFARGIIRKEDDKYRLFTSPPLKILQTKDVFYLFSSPTIPATELNSSNSGYWKNGKGIHYDFSIDSLNQNEFFGTFSFPVEKLFKGKGKLF